MKLISSNLFLFIILATSFSAHAADEDSCLPAVKSAVIKGASILTLGTVVTEVKEIVATGKTLPSAYDETLLEYKTGIIITEDGFIPNSSAQVYVLKNAESCTVMRLKVNLR